MATDWALCVGIGHYGSRARLDPLPEAVDEAKAMHAWLTSPDGGNVSAEFAELITSPSPQKAPPSPAISLIQAFYDRIDDAAAASQKAGDGYRAGRRLWLFFAGHGIGFAGHDDAGLLVADAVYPRRPTHVPGKSWIRPFQLAGAFDEIVLLMDCCRTEVRDLGPTTYSLNAGLGERARMAAAFASVNSTATYGGFTPAVLGLLRSPPQRPMTARAFLDHLEKAYPQVDPYPPRSASNDFDLIPAPPPDETGSPPPSPASLLIAHGESTFDLAGRLAERVRAPGRDVEVDWAPNVEAAADDAFDAVRDLLITRDVDEAELSRLIAKVRPARTLLFAKRNPGLSQVRFIERDESVDEEGLLTQVVEHLDQRASLVVHAADRLARLRVWSDDALVAKGQGSVSAADLPQGVYVIQATLGTASSREIVDLGPGETVVDLPTLLPAAWTILTPEDEGTCGTRRRVLRWEHHRGFEVRLSVPALEGWRTELRREPGGQTSVRLVPSDLPSGAPCPTDDLREQLRLIVADPRAELPNVPVADLASDPVALLLLAALEARLPQDGRSGQPALDAAGLLLGEEDVDVRLLRGDAAPIACPPLLSASWQRALRGRTLTVAADSLADQASVAVFQAPPWFGWFPDRADAPSWLEQAADAVWPGWDGERPKVAWAAPDLDHAAKTLNLPKEVARRHSYKSPPVDRLVAHDSVVFLGASNDQLAAALVVAFVHRAHDRWARLEVWSLEDEPLREMESDGRTGDALVAARDDAEARLAKLLPQIANAYEVHRYPGIVLGGERTFASLWDWTAPGGFVHGSGWRPGDDVRTTSATNEAWDGAGPPDGYAEVVAAYEALRSGGQG